MDINDLKKYRWPLLYVLVAVLTVKLLVAADPAAIKVQGPDTVGNPVPMAIAGTAASGTFQTSVTSSSNGANAAQTATLPAVAAKTTYITGFEFTGLGCTAIQTGTVTVAGTISGSMVYSVGFPAGVSQPCTPLVVQFTQPIPGNAVNTAITVTVTAAGAGNTFEGIVAHGFQQ